MRVNVFQLLNINKKTLIRKHGIGFLGRPLPPPHHPRTNADCLNFYMITTLAPP